MDLLNYMINSFGELAVVFIFILLVIYAIIIIIDLLK